jgi:hypothetical protein
MSAPKSEAELAAVVVAWLEVQNWDVYQEVSDGGPVIDIVAVRGPVVWTIECKLALNLTVLAQAEAHRTHLRSVAVPTTKRAFEERRLCMRVAKHYLQVGILEAVGDEHARGVRIVTPAPLLRHNHSEAQRLRAKLRPEHKTHAKAGAAGGGYWTPYKETMRDVRNLLVKAGPQGLSLREIMGGLDKHHWANERSMRSCLPTALESYEKDWCRVAGEGRGKRYLLAEASR